MQQRFVEQQKRIKKKQKIKANILFNQKNFNQKIEDFQRREREAEMYREQVIIKKN